MPNTVEGPSIKAFSKQIFCVETVSKNVVDPPGWLNIGTRDVVGVEDVLLVLVITLEGNIDLETVGEPTSRSERLTSKSAKAAFGTLGISSTKVFTSDKSNPSISANLKKDQLKSKIILRDTKPT